MSALLRLPRYSAKPKGRFCSGAEHVCRYRIDIKKPQHCVDEELSIFFVAAPFLRYAFVSANYCGVLNAFIVAKADMRTKHIVLRIRESGVYSSIGVTIGKKLLFPVRECATK